MDKNKEFIFSIANALILSNGKTTNLEIKNLAHEIQPGCGLSQSNVSDVMNVLFAERNIWERENINSNGKYFEYTLKDNTTDGVYAKEALEAVVKYKEALEKSNKVTILATNIFGNTASTNIVASNSSPTVKNKAQWKGASIIDEVKNLSDAYLKDYPQKAYIAYSTNHPAMLTTSLDKYEARLLFKQKTGERHVDVRMVQVETWLRISGKK